MCYAWWKINTLNTPISQWNKVVTASCRGDAFHRQTSCSKLMWYLMELKTGWIVAAKDLRVGMEVHLPAGQRAYIHSGGAPMERHIHDLEFPSESTNHNSTEILKQDLKISVPRHVSSSLTVVELLQIEEWPNISFSVSLAIYLCIFINTHTHAPLHPSCVWVCVTLLCSFGWKKKTAEDADTAGSGQLFVLWGTNRVHLHALSSSAFVIFNLNKNQLWEMHSQLRQRSDYFKALYSKVLFWLIQSLESYYHSGEFR